jgi:UDP:flavonoid glycosyltransferase YjiC (YdhE family)
MASFLFAATPAAGHLNPALPIVRALVEAGHTVTLTTGPQFEPAVTASGARFVPMPPDASIDAATLDERFPARAGRTGIRLIRHDLVHFFTAPAAAQALHVLALLAAQPADVLVADTGFVGGGLVAERTGIPFGVYGISVFPYASRDVAPFGSALPPRADRLGRIRNRAMGALLRRFVAGPSVAALDEQRRRVGLPPAGRSVLDWNGRTGLYLQLSPPGYDYPRSDLPPVVHQIGMPEPPVPPGWTPPGWWPVLHDRRVVVVTQGTVATDPTQLLRPALAGLAGLDVVVVALAADPAALGPLPANARSAAFIPYGPLMRRAAAVVTNGGFGGVQLALAAGVPLVVAGRTEDKGEVAARVRWSGVGLDLRTQQPAPAEVAAAVRQVLATPAFARRARELAARAPSAEAPARALALLEQLARTGAPVVHVSEGPVGGVGRRP